MLSVRGDYLATESSCDTSCCVGSLNTSGITLKECVGHSGLKLQSANISLGMRFEECRPRFADGGLDHSEFRLMAEVSSPVQRKKKRDFLC